jgi:hypothetical protein
MKRLITAAATAAGSLALLGGALVAGGGPALAAPGNMSWGADASGPQTLLPVAVATPYYTPNAASNANLAGLLATSAIVDRADNSGAWSRIGQGIVLTLPNDGSLTASGARSWCQVSSFSGNVYGGARIFSGAVMELGYQTIGLPSNPAPNTVITLPGGAGTITLNYQNTGGLATKFVAIHAELSGGQTVDLAASKCYSRRS